MMGGRHDKGITPGVRRYATGLATIGAAVLLTVTVYLLGRAYVLNQTEKRVGDPVNEAAKFVGSPLGFEYDAAIMVTAGFVAVLALAVASLLFIGRLRAAVSSQTRDLQEREQRLDHLNRMLTSVRNVNLIAKHEDHRDRLLDLACKKLVETRAFNHAHIVLVEDGRPVPPFHCSGLDERREAMADSLRAGEIPLCALQALSEPGMIVMAHPASMCDRCPLASACSEQAGLCARLEHAGRVFGWLTVSVPREHLDAHEERALFAEIADDIASALWTAEMERKHRRTEERHAAVLASTTDAVIAADLEGNITLVNQGAERLFKCKAEDVLGTSVMQFCPDDLLAAQNLLLRKVTKQGALQGIETERLTTDGKRIPVEMTVSVRTDAKERPVGFSAILRDISDRKQAEDALRESEEKYRLLFDGADVLVSVYDRDGVCKLMNSKEAALFGGSPADFVGMSFAELHPDQAAEYTRRVRDAIDTNVSQGYEDEVHFPEGPRWLLSTVHPVRDGAGEIHAAQIISQDITQRVFAEEAQRIALQELRESEERLREAQAMARLGSWTWDVKTGNVEWSSEVYEIFQLDPSNFTPHIDSILDLSPWPEDHQRDKELIAKAIESHERGAYEQRFLRPDGSTGYYYSTFRGQYDDQGALTRIVGTVQDISERKQAREEKARLEARLQQAQELETVGRLAGGVAHDFNSMLGVILGHTALALDEMGASHPFREDIEEIDKAARRAVVRTRQLLGLAPKQAISPEVLDLNDAVASMLRMLSCLIGQGVDLEWRSGARVWPVMIDPSQVEQLLTNLCANARDAIGGAGNITIESRNIHLDDGYCADHPDSAPGDYVQLSITDNGRGMDAATLARVFEPFFTTKESGQGTGLGLTTVHAIVKQNGGSVDVHTEPGQGTSFSVYLPRHVEKAEQAQTPWQAGNQVREGVRHSERG